MDTERIGARYTMLNKCLMAGVLSGAAMLLSPVGANAQFPSPNNGHALDANNQVGSGGTNPQPQDNNQVTGNQIMTGNVTAGRQFRGAVPYTDPHYMLLRLPSQGYSDFIKNSTGMPAPYQAPPMMNQPQPFYAADRLATPAPKGFELQGNTGTLLPTPRTQDQADPRTGQPLEPLRVDVIRPGDSLLYLAPDARAQEMTALTASPLYGVQQFRSSEAADRYFLNSYTDIRGENPLNRLGLDDQALRRMQEELDKPEVPGQLPGQKLPDRMGQPSETPQTPKLNETPLGGALENQPLSGAVKVDQRTFSRLIAPVTAQSTQYAELRNQLDRYYIDRLKTDEQANRELLAQLRARQAAEQKPVNGNPPASGPTSQPGFGVPDYARITRELVKNSPPGTVLPAAAPKPVRIASLAKGVKAPGLANLLNQAEILMRQGKFLSAIDQYDAAGQVAPNNWMVWLGRANAELGAMLYTRAEMHLRQALAGDPTLLMGQYDLKAMMGEERLAQVVADLKKLAETDANSPRPAFLLAYLAYNTGAERQAGTYLDLAEKRSGGQDDFYKLLRQHWSLGGGASQP